MCHRCNAVFDAKVAEIFEKEKMKKELACREEQVRQSTTSRRSSEPVSFGPQRNLAAIWLGEVDRHRAYELQEREAYEAPHRARREASRGRHRGARNGPRGNNTQGH
ncbi:hypothetical protein PIB30_085264, partial [Stylosanthes scabra]|nr:hypothetical protein [Stylosanthes scabra]